MERGVRRWLVDISKWNPSRDEFSFLVSLFPPNEHSCITRFVKLEDRKRAVVSRLLQYSLVNEVLGVPFNEITIRRTVEGKPYLESVAENLEFPNFNFNVSHHGDYVGIASEPLCLVGLDIVSHVVPMRETSLEYIANFSPYLSRLEWYSIITAGTGDQILGDFYRLRIIGSDITFNSGWDFRNTIRLGFTLTCADKAVLTVQQLFLHIHTCLLQYVMMEAFVKAIGAGVSFRLDRLEFHHTDWSDISVRIDGEESTEWKFCLFELVGGNHHWVSVAKGHPRMATKNYKQTLKRTEFGDDEYCLGLQLPHTGFVYRKIEQLIPDSHLVSYNIYCS